MLVQKTRKKAAEKSLRRKTEELDRFFSVSLDLSCIANTRGHFLRLNPAWERILGYRREELMAGRFFDFVHPDDLAGTREAVSRLAAQRFLCRAAPDVGEVRQILDDIIRDDRRAGEVLQKVRALVRKEKPLQEFLDLNSAIQEVVALIRDDRVQLQQVILNLILNSAAAMKNSPQAQRKIIVRTAMPDTGTVKASVTDFGTGIDENNLERLFEPFCATKAEGLGMGLSISQRIITAHGGTLGASNNPQSGATFAFTLPAHPGDAP